MPYKIYTHEKPDGRTTYCGPTVLMLLTGMTCEEVEASINRYINKQHAPHNGRTVGIRGSNGGIYYHRIGIKPNKLVDQVFGMRRDYMFGMLKKLKFNPEWVQKNPHMTLKTFAEDREFMPHPTVVVLNNHYVLIYKGMVYDTKSRQGCVARDHVNAGKRVEEYFNMKKRARS